MNPAEIESHLRAAPSPRPPAGLQARLKAGLQLAPAGTPASATSGRLETGGAGWFQRWWPALVAAGAVAACGAIFVYQDTEIRDLRAALDAASAAATAPAVTTTTATAAPALATAGSGDTAPVSGERAELVRLRAEVAALQESFAQLAQIAAENKALQAQLTTQSGVSPEDQAALEQARQRASAIVCINNLKNYGLALRIFATDNHDTFPADILSLTNELGSPLVLICPADPGRSSARTPAGRPGLDWSAIQSIGSSYEFLAPNGTDADPQRVAARCPFHGHVLLSDGSVQGNMGQNPPISSHLVVRDGKTYFQ